MKAIKLLLFSCVLALGSCTTDPCVDTTCYNDGVCDDGTCMCTDWYEGMDCSTEERAKYYGSYTGALNFYDEAGDLLGANQVAIPVSVGSIFVISFIKYEPVSASLTFIICAIVSVANSD